MTPDTDNIPTKASPSDHAPDSGGYEPPSIMKVGDFASDTHGSVSVGSSDDSDAGQYYA